MPLNNEVGKAIFLFIYKLVYSLPFQWNHKSMKKNKIKLLVSFTLTTLLWVILMFLVFRNGWLDERSLLRVPLIIVALMLWFGTEILIIRKLASQLKRTNLK